MNAALATMKVIQSEDTNPNKTKVRAAIRQQVEAFAKQQGKLSMVSLPATEWLIEKELLASCKAGNIPCHIVGLEKNPLDPSTFYEVEKNKPYGKNVEIFYEDFDSFHFNFRHGGDGRCDDSDVNVFWADYCGCYKKGERNRGSYWGSFRIKYPHLYKFFSLVEGGTHDKTPFLYYMTFSLNGRIEGGRNGKDAIQFAQEIKTKIAMHATANKVTNIVPIMSVVYKAAKRQTMITLGFAINIENTEYNNFWSYLNGLPDSLPFQPVKAKWLTKGDEVVEYKSSKGKTSETTKQQIRDLSDKGLSSQQIANKLGLSRRQVGPVLAWHLHADSWTL